MRTLFAALALLLCTTAHAQRGDAEPAAQAPGKVSVPARTFIDTARWTCLVDARGAVHCTMRSSPDFWPAPTIPATGSSFEQVSGLSGVTALEGTGEYLCALDRRGVVQCWGCLYSMCRLWPKRIALAEPARQIVVENVGACALLQSGAVQCWGSGSSGQFGYSRAQPIVTEQPLSVPLQSKAVQLSATTDARCALDEQGSVICWGAVCGAGDSLGLQPRHMPKLEQVSAIAGNASFTCAVAGAQREVRCWGHPDAAQTSLQASAGLHPGRCEIATLRNLSHVKQLALGYLSGAALTDEGALYYWGESHYGGVRQLAGRIDPDTHVELDHDYRPITSPDPQPRKAKRYDQEPVRVAAGLPVRRAMLSGNYVCLELEGGEVRCEWTLSKTPFQIREVWPSVRFDSGTGGSP